MAPITSPVARLAVGLALAAAVLAVPVSASASSAPAVTAAATPALAPAALTPAAVEPTPSRLNGVGLAQQVIVVTDANADAYAKLWAYQRTSSGWKRVMGPISARIGPNGFVLASQRRQGSNTTPAGSFALGPAFGSGAGPGGHLPYRVIDGTDRWVYDRSDPSTYNTFQPSGNWGNQERLSEIKYRQYRYAVVIGFNHPVMSMNPSARPRSSRYVDTSRGGGIFLHVKKYLPGASHSEPTAGCVSVDEPYVRSLVRWLNPSARPRIIMGPRSLIIKRTASLASASLAPAATTSTFGYSSQGRALTVQYRHGSGTATHRLLVIGSIHGDERAGSTVVSQLRAMTLPAGVGVWTVGTMNPDGVRADRRGNARGVDLNRNFPRSWVSANRYTSRWSGPSAGSEQETKAVMALLKRVKPDLVVIFHQPYGAVDTYGAKSPATVKAIAEKSGFPRQYMDCSGGCHGTLTQWFNATQSGQAVTFEFGHSWPSTTTAKRVAGALVSVVRGL